MRIKNPLSFFKPFAFLTLFLTLVLVGVVLAATVTVDAFNEGTQNLPVDPDTPINSSTIDHASILGGERDAVVNWTAGAGEVRLEIDRFGSNLLSFSQGSGITGNSTVTWDGNDSSITLDPDGLGEDLVDSGPANDGFLISIVNSDLGLNLVLNVYTDGTNFSTRTVAVPGGITSGSRVDLIIPFSSFSTGGGAGATFSNVGAIEMVINSTSVSDADVSIDLFESTPAREYGDLPGTYNMTTLADNGARHLTSDGLRLGNNRDAEPDGVESVPASGDDGASTPDDEDGIVRSGAFWNPTNGGSVDVTVNGCTGTCRVSGWIDWTNDGDFNDAGEQVLNDNGVTNGTQTRTFAIPGGTIVPNNSFYARFRLCATTSTCNALTGEVTGGEVEDYRWAFSPTAVTMNSASIAFAAGNIPLAVTLVIGLFVGTGLLLARRKR